MKASNSNHKFWITALKNMVEDLKITNYNKKDEEINSLLNTDVTLTLDYKLADTKDNTFKLTYRSGTSTSSIVSSDDDISVIQTEYKYEPILMKNNNMKLKVMQSTSKIKSPPKSTSKRVKMKLKSSNNNSMVTNKNSEYKRSKSIINTNSNSDNKNKDKKINKTQNENKSKRERRQCTECCMRFFPRFEDQLLCKCCMLKSESKCVCCHTGVINGLCTSCNKKPAFRQCRKCCKGFVPFVPSQTVCKECISGVVVESCQTCSHNSGLPTGPCSPPHRGPHAACHTLGPAHPSHVHKTCIPNPCIPNAPGVSNNCCARPVAAAMIPGAGFKQPENSCPSCVRKFMSGGPNEKEVGVFFSAIIDEMRTNQLISETVSAWNSMDSAYPIPTVHTGVRHQHSLHQPSHNHVHPRPVMPRYTGVPHKPLFPYRPCNF